MVVGRPTLRSVDSERVGRVIEPRKRFVEGADAVVSAEGNIEAPILAWCRDPSGVCWEQGTHARVCPGTWEPPWSPQQNAPGGQPAEQGSRPTVAGAGRRGSERRASAAVPPSEGNEVKREGP